MWRIESRSLDHGMRLSWIIDGLVLFFTRSLISYESILLLQLGSGLALVHPPRTIYRLPQHLRSR